MKKAMLVLISLFLVGLVALSSAPEAVAQSTGRVVLNMGSSSSVAAPFVYAAALTRVINKHTPGIRVSVIESGATYDNLRRIKEGVFDFATVVTFSGAYELYSGLKPFEGTPWPEIRFLWLREMPNMQLIVRKDAGIKTIQDLAGKKFSPGVPGGAASMYCMRIMQVLGIKVDLVHASKSDAMTALSDRRLVGVSGSGSPDHIDGSLLEVHQKVPLTVIGLTKRESEAVAKAYPLYPFAYVRTGQYSEAPEAGDHWVVTMPSGTVASKKLSEDIVYRMTKAVHENYKEVVTSYPQAGSYDPVVDAIKAVPAHWPVPLHVGVVRYAREKRIEVPAHLIPAEYKGR